jgi:hypothetical protein
MQQGYSTGGAAEFVMELTTARAERHVLQPIRMTAALSSLGAIYGQ